MFFLQSLSLLNVNLDYLLIYLEAMSLFLSLKSWVKVYGGKRQTLLQKIDGNKTSQINVPLKK